MKLELEFKDSLKTNEKSCDELSNKILEYEESITAFKHLQKVNNNSISNKIYSINAYKF